MLPKQGSNQWIKWILLEKSQKLKVVNSIIIHNRYLEFFSKFEKLLLDSNETLNTPTLMQASLDLRQRFGMKTPYDWFHTLKLIGLLLRNKENFFLNHRGL